MEPVAFATLVRPDRASGEPLAGQIYRILREAIRAGRLGAGARLPSSRAAAEALGVSRNTVSAAYELLRAEGAVAGPPRAAPRVLDLAPRPETASDPGDTPPGLSTRGRALAEDHRSGLYFRPQGRFMPGSPDEALFPRDLWARTLRRAAREGFGQAASYGDYFGLERLRATLAERLQADRGLDVSPERVLVTPGAQAALALVAQTLCNPGEAALVESPGYAGARAAFSGAGLRLMPLPVDEEGADIARATEAEEARLAYVTPSNQYPLGVRMSLARRLALIDWARAGGGLIVEDDYDSEFHWRGRAIGALQALAPDVTLYVGSAAKSLTPGLRLGWIVAPPALVAPLRRAHRNLGLGGNLHAQAALASLMESGEWRAHLRRIAHAYEARGRLLAEALEARFGNCLQVRRPDGGLQLALELPTAETEVAAMARLGAAGFAVAALSAFGCGGPARPGLVIGFAEAEPRLVGRFVATLAEALKQ